MTAVQISSDPAQYQDNRPHMQGRSLVCSAQCYQLWLSAYDRRKTILEGEQICLVLVINEC